MHRCHIRILIDSLAHLVYNFIYHTTFTLPIDLQAKLLISKVSESVTYHAPMRFQTESYKRFRKKVGEVIRSAQFRNAKGEQVQINYGNSKKSLLPEL